MFWIKDEPGALVRVWCAEWREEPREDQPRLRVALAPDGTVAVRRWVSAKGAHTRAEKTERVQQLRDLLHSGETVTVAEATKFLSLKSRNSAKANWRAWWTRDG